MNDDEGGEKCIVVIDDECVVLLAVMHELVAFEGKWLLFFSSLSMANER